MEIEAFFTLTKIKEAKFPGFIPASPIHFEAGLPERMFFYSGGPARKKEFFHSGGHARRSAVQAGVLR